MSQEYCDWQTKSVLREIEARLTHRLGNRLDERAGMGTVVAESLPSVWRWAHVSESAAARAVTRRGACRRRCRRGRGWLPVDLEVPGCASVRRGTNRADRHHACSSRTDGFSRSRGRVRLGDRESSTWLACAVSVLYLILGFLVDLAVLAPPIGPKSLMGERTTGTNPTLSAILRQSLASSFAATPLRRTGRSRLRMAGQRQASVMKDVLSGSA